MQDEEQEKFLNDALNSVKAQSYHIRNTIDRNQMRQCLRETSQMLIELKTNILTPKSYYNLYTAIFDEMQYVYNFFKEEARRGRRINDLYDTVQQASNLIPRLYLMVTAGAVYIENKPSVSKEIIYDLLGMVKGVQNPTRGLFTRYYLLKMVKDKLPDTGNEFLSDTTTINDTIQFILQNLEEMNRLWIRLSANVTGNEKVVREKERVELRILVGENIVRLSSLDGLKLDMYRTDILPKLIKIILNSKDSLSQQYIMECIIHAFPDEFNIQCMDTILNTLTELNQSVDVISLFIALMDKLAKYVKDSGKEESDILLAAEKIFGSLRQSIDTLTEQVTSNSEGILEPNKLIELQLAFMKFSINCCPEKDKLETTNHILSTAFSILSSYNKKLNREGGNLLRQLLSVPLESKLSIFDFKKFPELMVYLDFTSRTTLSIRIIESLSNKERLDSSEKVNQLFEYIRTLLEDSNETIETDANQFEYEQNIVAKILYVISTNDPVKLLNILIAIIPKFAKGGNRRIKYTLPTLANAFIRLGYQITCAYETKYGSSQINDQSGIHNEFISTLDIDQISSNDVYIDFMNQIHSHLKEIMLILVDAYPEITFKLYLNAALQANSIQFDESGKIYEYVNTYITEALNIYTNSELDIKNKVQLLINLMGTLMHIRNISSERMIQIVQTIQQLGQSLIRRADQCNAMLCCSSLYFTFNDTQKTMECLKKAKRFADFAMTNPENLSLFIIILNKYIYYIEACGGDCFIPNDEFEDVLEIIKNHIFTIENEGTCNKDFLVDVKKHFDITIDIIKKRKEEGRSKVYAEIPI